MSRYYGLHIISAAVAYLDGIFIEYFRQLIAFRKMFFQNFKEHLSNVCFNIQRKRRVEPDDFPFSFDFIVGVCFVRIFMNKICAKTTVLNEFAYLF